MKTEGSSRNLRVVGRLALIIAFSFPSAPLWAQGAIERSPEAERMSLDLELTMEKMRSRALHDLVSVYPDDYPRDHGDDTNTHLGDFALTSLTSGTDNTGIGNLALAFLTSGSFNTATGSGSLTSTFGSEHNTANGFAALFSNGTGDSNTGAGSIALAFNTSGSFNSGFGAGALGSNTTGRRNSAFGFGALIANLTGALNTAVGFGALGSNLSGALNTAIGANALGGNVSGGENTAVGPEALLALTSGQFNTGISPRALLATTTGDQNVGIGLRAGSFNETGSRNIFIGFRAGANSKYVSANDQLVIHGNQSASPLIEGDFVDRTLRVNGDFTATSLGQISDVRLKTDIRPLDGALAAVLRLEGKSFGWRHDAYPEEGFTQGPDIGLIAQEVEQVLPQLVNEDRDGYLAVHYSKLTAVLVEAVKEQQGQIEALLTRVAELEGR